MFVDSHQHFWQVGRFEYPWMSSDLGVLYRDYLPPTLESILKANRVEKTVLVQASNSVEESRWLLNLANQYPFIAGVVGWVDLTSDNVVAQLDLLAHPKFKGVRHLVESEPADDWLSQPVVLSGLQTLAQRDLTYDLLVHIRHLSSVHTVAENCPGLRLVIDHMAKPPIGRSEFDEWAKRLKPLASFPNLHCKLSGLVTEANWNTWTTDDLRPYIDWALESFGPDRVLFGSDYPVCLLAATYERVLESFQEALKDLKETERMKIFRDNAIQFYQLRQ
jgi:L-fuconolactonase